MNIYKIWIIFSFAVLFAASEEKAITRCVEYSHNTSPQSIRLICDHDQMISVTRVIKAMAKVSLENAHNWCDFPLFSSTDCYDYEDTLTNKYRSICNTISVCSTQEQYTPVGQCGNMNSDGNTAQKEYIHLQYECLPRYDQSQQIPFMQICPGELRTEEGNTANIMSRDYPAMSPASAQCLCVITLPVSKYVILRIMDMDYTTHTETSCPIHLDVPGNARCAESKTNHYRDITLLPADHQLHSPLYNMHINILSDGQVINRRLWILVTAIDLNSHFESETMTITCNPGQALQPDPNIPTVTTTTIKLEDNATLTAHTDSTDDSSLYGIIGGCIAGLFVVIFIIVILVICYRKRRKYKKEHCDLGYMCHANVAAAKRLGAENAAYTNTERQTVSIIDPYAKSGGPYLSENEQNGAASVYNVYSDVGDIAYNRDSQYSDVDSGQYSSLGPSTSKLHCYQNIKTNRASSGISDGESVIVVDSEDLKGGNTTQLYAVPLKPNRAPKPPSVPVHITGGQNLYAQPDKTKKAKLACHTSISSETQMVENDLYNADVSALNL